MIAYIESEYRVDHDDGLCFANGGEAPTERSSICVWQVRTGARHTMLPPQARGKVLTSLTWRSEHELACLVTDVGRRDRSLPGLRGEWNWPLTYRWFGLKKELLICSMGGKEPRFRTTRVPRTVTHLEAGRPDTGDVVLWELRKPRIKYLNSVRSYRTFTARGELTARHEVIPYLLGVPWATVRTEMPVVVRDRDPARPGTSCALARLYGDGYQDLYSPARVILGVYGSPHRDEVAFYEELSTHPRDARASLRVVPTKGGTPRVIASDAWWYSHVAWSPEGKRVAYCRARDGKIVIADVGGTR